MTLKYYFKGDSKEALMDLAVQVGIATLDEDGQFVLGEEVFLDPIPYGPEWETGLPIPVYDAEGNTVGVKEGYHANVEIWGERERRETEGFAQTDAEGNLLPLYERTKFGRMMKDNGSYQTDGGVKMRVLGGVAFLYESSINTPYRVKQ